MTLEFAMDTSSSSIPSQTLTHGEAIEIAIAIGLYWLWGALLIAQNPGLQDDEALLVAGARIKPGSPVKEMPDRYYFVRCADVHCTEARLGDLFKLV